VCVPCKLVLFSFFPFALGIRPIWVGVRPFFFRLVWDCSRASSGRRISFSFQKAVMSVARWGFRRGGGLMVFPFDWAQSSRTGFFL